MTDLVLFGASTAGQGNSTSNRLSSQCVMEWADTLQRIWQRHLTEPELRHLTEPELRHHQHVMERLGLGLQGHQKEIEALFFDWCTQDFRTETLRWCLDSKLIDINQTRYIGMTGLQHATIADNARAARVLLQSNAHVDVPFDRGWTPLFHACRRGRHSLAALLLEHGANPNHQVMAPEWSDLTRPARLRLHSCLSCPGSAETAILLLRAKADPSLDPELAASGKLVETMLAAGYDAIAARLVSEHGHCWPVKRHDLIASSRRFQWRWSWGSPLTYSSFTAIVVPTTPPNSDPAAKLATAYEQRRHRLDHALDEGLLGIQPVIQLASGYDQDREQVQRLLQTVRDVPSYPADRTNDMWETCQIGAHSVYEWSEWSECHRTWGRATEGMRTLEGCLIWKAEQLVPCGLPPLHDLLQRSMALIDDHGLYAMVIQGLIRVVMGYSTLPVVISWMQSLGVPPVLSTRLERSARDDCESVEKELETDHRHSNHAHSDDNGLLLLLLDDLAMPGTWVSD